MVQTLLGAVRREMNGKAHGAEFDGSRQGPDHLHQNRALNRSTRVHSAQIRHPMFPVSSQHLHLPPADGIRALSSGKLLCLLPSLFHSLISFPQPQINQSAAGASTFKYL